MVSLLPLQGQFRLILLRALFTGKETELQALKKDQNQVKVTQLV